MRRFFIWILENQGDEGTSLLHAYPKKEAEDTSTRLWYHIRVILYWAENSTIKTTLFRGFVPFYCHAWIRGRGPRLVHVSMYWYLYICVICMLYQKPRDLLSNGFLRRKIDEIKWKFIAKENWFIEKLIMPPSVSHLIVFLFSYKRLLKNYIMAIKLYIISRNASWK